MEQTVGISCLLLSNFLCQIEINSLTRYNMKPFVLQHICDRQGFAELHSWPSHFFYLHEQKRVNQK